MLPLPSPCDFGPQLSSQYIFFNQMRTTDAWRGSSTMRPPFPGRQQTVMHD